MRSFMGLSAIAYNMNIVIVYPRLLFKSRALLQCFMHDQTEDRNFQNRDIFLSAFIQIHIHQGYERLLKLFSFKECFHDMSLSATWFLYDLIHSKQISIWN